MSTQLTQKLVISGPIVELFSFIRPKEKRFSSVTSSVKRYFVGSSDIRLDNVLRTKSRFKRLVRSNADLTKFITLTFADNVVDLTYANKYFNQFIKRFAKLYPNFKYIAVPEFQKRGAVHYHLLVNIPTYVSPEVLSNAWGAGFVSIKNLRKLKVNRIDLYMVKYLTKDIDNRLFGRRRFLYSRNVLRPLVLPNVSQYVIMKMLDGLELIYKKSIHFTWGASLNYYQYSLQL